MGFLQSILPTIQHFSVLSYWIIFLFAFCESLAFVGLVIPGSIAVIFAGFLASQGVLDIGDLFWFAAIGAILGDSLSFYLGKRGALIFKEKNKIFKLAHLKKGEAFFKKHGGKSVFLGRFIGWVRPIIPFIAGLAKLDRKTFLTWNISSGLLWSAVHLTVGYFFGQAWQAIEVWSTRIGVFIAAILIGIFILYWAKLFVLKKGKTLAHFFVSLWLSIKEAFSHNPDVRRFRKKHPLLLRFLSQRFSPKTFFGLPFTLLSVSFLYVLGIFLGTIEDIISADIITGTDVQIANLFAAFRHPQLIKVFLWITALGKWQVIIIWFLIGSFLLWLWNKKEYVLGWLLALLGSESSVFISKIAFHRPRPINAVYLENSFSFPSGHATISVAFYGFIIYLCWRLLKKWSYKINALFIGLTVIILIGLSRLYLDVHYLSDVWGGYLLGFLWLVAGISISEWLLSIRLKYFSCPPVLSRHKKGFLISLISFSLLFYGGFAANYRPPLKTPPIRETQLVKNPLNIFTLDRLPKYTSTLTGKRQEPISFIIVAPNDQVLINAFKQAGWFLADKVSLKSLIKVYRAAFSKKPYPEAPMTPSFWHRNVHNFGFEKPTKVDEVSQRHHARFWQTYYRTKSEGYIYVGSASLDKGIKWGITHKIKPDIDTEREFLFQDLMATGFVSHFSRQQFVPPTLGENFAGDAFFTDGKSYIIFLK